MLREWVASLLKICEGASLKILSYRLLKYE